MVLNLEISSQVFIPEHVTPRLVLVSDLFESEKESTKIQNKKLVIKSYQNPSNACTEHSFQETQNMLKLYCSSHLNVFISGSFFFPHNPLLDVILWKLSCYPFSSGRMTVLGGISEVWLCQLTPISKQANYFHAGCSVERLKCVCIFPY